MSLADLFHHSNPAVAATATAASASTGKQFLQVVGADFRSVMHAADTVFVRSEPVLLFAARVLATIYPIQGGIALTAVNGAIATEQQFAAIGAQNGTGQQKLTQTLQVAGPAIAQDLSAAGAKGASVSAADVVNKVVSILNIDPQLLEQIATLFSPLNAQASQPNLQPLPAVQPLAAQPIAVEQQAAVAIPQQPSPAPAQ